MRATSRMRTCDPSVLTFSRMLPNSAGVRSSVASVIVAVSRWVAGAGVPPSWPPATWTFWFSIAVVTSTGVNAKLFELVRVEPDAHRVLRAEHAEVADAVDPAHRVLHVREAM